jgi:hypothetical protein
MTTVPKFEFKGATVATTYRFEPSPDKSEGAGWGWALCTVNDATGELSVQSDWGNWSHRWSANPKHLGAPTLTHFIGERGSCHYLADKLSRESGPRSGEEFDVDETIKRFRGILSERRLEQARAWVEYYRDEDPEDTPDVLSDPPRWADKKPYRGTHYGSGGWYEDKGEPLTRGIARAIWEALGSLHECVRSVDLFCERFFRIPGYAWITDEPWELTVYSPTIGYRLLLGGILPALVEACAAEVKRRAELEQAPACTGHLVHDEFTACPAHDARELR